MSAHAIVDEARDNKDTNTVGKRMTTNTTRHSLHLGIEATNENNHLLFTGMLYAQLALACSNINALRTIDFLHTHLPL